MDVLLVVVVVILMYVSYIIFFNKKKIKERKVKTNVVVPEEEEEKEEVVVVIPKKYNNKYNKSKINYKYDNNKVRGWFPFNELKDIDTHLLEINKNPNQVVKTRNQFNQDFFCFRDLTEQSGDCTPDPVDKVQQVQGEYNISNNYNNNNNNNSSNNNKTIKDIYDDITKQCVDLNAYFPEKTMNGKPMFLDNNSYIGGLDENNKKQFFPLAKLGGSYL